MSQTGSINYVPLVPWLQGQGSNVFTQFGEDGLIAACLEKIGETNRQCFEIGAADGEFFSNTLRLRQQGWKAVLIESDARKFADLKDEYGHESFCVHETVTDLDSVLARSPIDPTPDVGVIDIDGQDYWLWHDLTNYVPRIMLAEISTQSADQEIPKRGEPYPAQAGLTAIEELGRQKGYTLVATTFCNALFVKTECL